MTFLYRQDSGKVLHVILPWLFQNIEIQSNSVISITVPMNSWIMFIAKKYGPFLGHKWSLLNINVHGYNEQLWMVPWYLLQPSLSVIETSKKIDLPRSLFQSYKLLNNLKFPLANHQLIGKLMTKLLTKDRQ